MIPLFQVSLKIEIQIEPCSKEFPNLFVCLALHIARGIIVLEAFKKIGETAFVVLPCWPCTGMRGSPGMRTGPE